MVNGFNSEEIVLLYKYICWFEKIKRITTDKSLYEQFPVQKGFWQHFKGKEFKSEKNNNMPKDAQKQKANVIVFTVSWKTRQLSILRHLRNSIAHGTFETDGKKVTLSDKSLRLKKCTCMGNISKSILMSFIE